MRIVAIKDMTAENAEVGEMWKETKIFDGKAPIREIMEWTDSRQVNVTITIPENNAEEFENNIKDLPF